MVKHLIFFFISSNLTEDGKYFYINYDNVIEKFDIERKKNIYSIPVWEPKYKVSQEKLDNRIYFDDVLRNISISGGYPYNNKNYIEDFFDFFVGMPITNNKLKEILEAIVEKKVKSIKSNYKYEFYDDFQEIKEQNSFGEQKKINQHIKIYDVYVSGNKVNDKIFDNNNNLIATFLFNDFNNWIIQTPDKYFFASKEVSKSLKYKSDNKIYTFDQFDLYFNRPDIVLERLGIGTKEIIEKYRNFYEKRVEKMGFKLNELKIDYEQPFINSISDDFPFSTKNQNLKFKFEAKDLKYKLDRINVYINDVPIYGTTGQSVKNKNTSTIAQELNIALSSGRNKIEISVHNEIGVESKRETFEVVYESPAVKPNLYLITIGVSDFQEVSKNLKFASKDAEDVLRLFKTNTTYGKVETIKLQNQGVSKDNILKIKERLKQSNIDDKVILFVSGHGVLDAKTQEWYYGTYDIDFSNPSAKGISYDELEDLLDGIPPRNKMFLLDACHSGELDKDMNTLASNSQKKQDRVFDGKGVPTNDAVNYNNSLEMMKEIFTDIRRYSGSNVISAASGDKLAFEDINYKNGYFTYAFLEGIRTKKADSNKDNKVTVSEIRNYVYMRVKEISNGKQSPTSRQENITNDFVIWQY